MFTPRGRDRALAEQSPATRDGRPVTVRVGMVVAEVNLRATLDQPLNEGTRPAVGG